MEARTLHEERDTLAHVDGLATTAATTRTPASSSPAAFTAATTSMNHGSLA